LLGVVCKPHLCVFAAHIFDLVLLMAPRMSVARAAVEGSTWNGLIRKAAFSALVVPSAVGAIRREQHFAPLPFSILDRGEEEGPSVVHLDGPSQGTWTFTADRPDMSYSQFGQDKILAPIFGQTKGFFVESGARDGESDSNTVFFEARGWQGLLVEPGPEYEQIAAKHRKVHAFHGALSPTGSSERLHFTGTADGLAHFESEASFVVQAEPLERLLAAVDPSLKTVDLWSLDIEGAESMVLENTDFGRIEVGVLLVEMNKTPENNAKISAVMAKNGFVDIGRTSYPRGYLDHVFVNPLYFSRRQMPTPSVVSGLS